MSDDSKKREELKRQIANRAQIAKLEFVEKAANFLHSPKKWDIVERLTVLPSGTNIESQRLIICFDYFASNVCIWDQFDPTKGKKLLEILEQVSKCEVRNFPNLKLGRNSVQNVAPYQSLFNKLTPDVTSLEETEFGDGRIFYFITEPCFHIVSIETKHRNIDS